jgi:uncharacterized protein YndB with AHSA1/START domain
MNSKTKKNQCPFMPFKTRKRAECYRKSNETNRRNFLQLMSCHGCLVRRINERQHHNYMTTNNTNTVRLHRVLRATPERVYRAFLDADAMAKWLPPNGFTGKVHHLDAKVGGGYQMTFTNFTTQKGHSFGGTYLELKPHERIRYTNRFDNPGLPGEMQTTITLRQVFCGTEINITQEGIPAMIPAEACYLGWQESLVLLGKLVEVEIPDQP